MLDGGAMLTRCRAATAAEKNPLLKDENSNKTK